MSSFFLVMAQYPHVQRKAQAGIDCVVGPDRLPSFQDRENLPYIYAMVKEILRWHPVLPMGTAHASVMDDTRGGSADSKKARSGRPACPRLLQLRMGKFHGMLR